MASPACGVVSLPAPLSLLAVFCGLALAASVLTAATAGVEIIAHRGASHDAPENTLAAMRLAWQQNADAAECDVWLSRDGHAIVIHDGDTKRVTGVAKKVAEQTLAELRQLDAGRWKKPGFAGERLPTLDEVLACVPAGKRMFIEIKCGVAGVPETLRAIRESALKPEEAVVISFSADVVAAIKKARPDLQAYWIVSLKPAKDKPPLKAEDLIATAKTVGADGLDLSAEPALDKTFAEKVTAAGLGLYVWTVDTAAEARRLQALGVLGITTNRPGALREWLK